MYLYILLASALSAVILYNELNSKDYNCVDYDRAIWVDLLVLFKLKKSAITASKKNINGYVSKNNNSETENLYFFWRTVEPQKSLLCI